MRFAVPRPALTDPVSPRCHRVPPGDISGGIEIGIAGEPAGNTAESRLALARLRGDVPAFTAPLTGVSRVNAPDSPVRLVPEALEEKAPSLGEDRAIQAGLLRDTAARRLDGATRRTRHAGDVQVLDLEDIVAPREIRRGLLDPILPAVPFAGAQSRDGALEPAAAVRAAHGTGQSSLQAQQALGELLAQRGRVEWLALARHHGDDHTAVQANDLAGAGTFDRHRDVREGDVPAAGGVAGDAVALHLRRDLARLPESHPADFGHEDGAPALIQSAQVVRVECDDAKAFVPIALPPGRAVVAAAKEVALGLVEISERLLLDRHAAGRQPRFGGAQFRQLPVQFGVARRVLAGLPQAPLFQGEIPDEPCLTAGVAEERFLLNRRGQPEPHVASILREAAIPPPTEVGGFLAGSL
jgi:hypothetical protein